MAVERTMIDALTEWVGAQRWFAGGRMRPQLALVSSVPLYSDESVRVEVLIVSDAGGSRSVFYHVPIVLRRQRREDSDLGLIGMIGKAGDEWFAYDGPTDSALTRRLLALLVEGGRFEGGRFDSDGVDGRSAWIYSPAGANIRYTDLRSSVLHGEQSNTSIVFSDGEADRVICKIFRMLHHGHNPDVVVQSALVAAGSTSVPPIVGSLIGEWPDDSQPNGLARGHLAFAQCFLAGAEDGWTRALTAVSQETGHLRAGFVKDARRIGVAIAEVHATLASAMPTREASESDVANTVFAWQRRLDAAIAEVPELAATRWSVEAVYSRAELAPWPRLQRIHGDLHLGQILATPDGAWVIIDFEGEPLRSLAERSLPDVPLRDVAGMLRSIDYAAGSRTASAGALEWARTCRAAFLDGYIERSHNDVRQYPDLLAAFELDKALYEVVYEARNRPAWLPIPIAAVRRLSHSAHDDNDASRYRFHGVLSRVLPHGREQR